MGCDYITPSVRREGSRLVSAPSKGDGRVSGDVFLEEETRVEETAVNGGEWTSHLSDS